MDTSEEEKANEDLIVEWDPLQSPPFFFTACD